MKKFSVKVKQVLMSTLSTAIIAMSFASCADEIDSINASADSQSPPRGAKTELLEAYGLTFHNFTNPDDVTIVDADTTQLSISKAYAEKMGIKSFKGHPMGIWHRAENLPYLRKCTGEKIVGDRIIIDVEGATPAEVLGQKAIELKSQIYVNQDDNAVKTRAASDNIPEYAAKYIDADNVIHPAYVHLTDPYGYDKDYHTPDDPVSEAMTRAAAEGNYMYMTADEIAASKTRWGCHNSLLHFKNKLEKQFDFPIGKNSKDSLYLKFTTDMEFGLNYFITLNGGMKWMGILPVPYLKKFEAGVDGEFKFNAQMAAGWEKKWELDKDKYRWELMDFPGYTFTFMVGPIPVAIASTPHLDFALDGEVGGAIETNFSYEYHNKFKGGFGYEDGRGFYPIKDFDEIANDFDMDPTNFSIEARAGVGLYLCCDLKIYGLAGPKLGVGPRLGAEFKAETSLARAEASVQAKVELTARAVIGAKVEVLGYELADQTFTWDLFDPWLIWKYNWQVPEGEKEKELHKSPKQQQQESLMPKFQQVVQHIIGLQSSFSVQYNDAVNMLIALKHYTREQAEQELLKQVLQRYPDFEKDDNMSYNIPRVQQTVFNYARELTPKYETYLAEESWKEVKAEIVQSPRYKELEDYIYHNFKVDVNLELVRKQFVSQYDREPANVKDDYAKLFSIMVYYAGLYYKSNAEVQKAYGQDFLNKSIAYGKVLKQYNDETITQAAYMLAVHLYKSRGDYFNDGWDNNYAERLKRLYRGSVRALLEMK